MPCITTTRRLLLADMKKLAAAVIAATALLLAGCGSTSPEDAYVAAVTDRAPSVLDRGTETELVSLGETTCESLQNGATADEMTTRYIDLGFTEADASAVVEEAETHLC